MKPSIILIIFLILFIPSLLFAEDKPYSYKQPSSDGEYQNSNPDVFTAFSEDLAELYAINEELKQEQTKMAAGKTSNIEEIIQRVLLKLKYIQKEYEKSPVKLIGFSINVPFGISVDFEVDLTKL